MSHFIDTNSKYLSFNQTLQSPYLNSIDNILHNMDEYISYFACKVVQIIHANNEDIGCIKQQDGKTALIQIKKGLTIKDDDIVLVGQKILQPSPTLATMFEIVKILNAKEDGKYFESMKTLYEILGKKETDYHG
jgi:hypothetical protein